MVILTCLHLGFTKADAIPVAVSEGTEQTLVLENPVPLSVAPWVLLVHSPTRCTRRYFNFDGRADSRIVRKVLGDIAPRALVITRGTEAARDDLCAKTGKELEGLASRVAVPGVVEGGGLQGLVLRVAAAER